MKNIKSSPMKVISNFAARLFALVLSVSLPVACHAAVASPSTWVQYTLSSNPQTLTVNFVFQSSGDLLVLDSKTSPPVTLTLNSDYSVSGGAGSTGTITTIAGGAHGVLVGDKITISRSVPLTQTTNFTNSGPLTARMVGQALDKLTEISQQINLLSLNSLQFQGDEQMSGVLGKTARTNKVVGFDASGNLFFYPPGGGGGGGGSNDNPTFTGTITYNNTGVAGLHTPLNVVNVKAYGVVGDNSADDTAAFQAAIVAAAGITSSDSAYGGAEVWIPAGVRMKITKTIIVPVSTGLSIVAEQPEDDPTHYQIQYQGNANFAAVECVYGTGVGFATTLTANATLAATSGSVCTVIPDNLTFLSPGGSAAGYLGTVYGTLVNTAGTYTFTRSADGFATTFVGGLSALAGTYTGDVFQMDNPSQSYGLPRKFIMQNVGVNGNGNVLGIMEQGHGSANFYVNVRTINTIVGFGLSQPPARGNDEFFTFIRCTFNAKLYCMNIAQGDSFDTALYNCDLTVSPSAGNRNYAACIRVNAFDGNGGSGLSVYGGNIGSTSVNPNNVAVLEVVNPGDPITFNGVRCESVSVAVRAINRGGTGRGTTFRDCSFPNLVNRALQLWQANTVYAPNTFFSTSGHTYQVLSDGTSGGSAPVTVDHSIETNGTMTCMYIALDNAQEDWPTWGRIVDTEFPQIDSTHAPGNSGNHMPVEFDNCIFVSGTFYASTPTDGLCIWATGAGVASYKFTQCNFDGRYFEFNPQGIQIEKRNCIMRMIPEDAQTSLVPVDDGGAPVNFLAYSGDASFSPWVIGGSATVQPLDSTAGAPYYPVLGGNGFNIGSTAPFQVAAAQVYQPTGITSTGNPNDHGYVLRGSTGSGNDRAIVTVTDAAGYLMGGGFFSGTNYFEIPFDTHSESYLSGAVRVVLSAIGINNTSAHQFLKNLQVAYRDIPCSYALTQEYPIDLSSDSSYHEFTHSQVNVPGRLVIPSVNDGSKTQAKYDLRGGDLRVNSVNQLTLFDGVSWQYHPRAFYQVGVAAPTTGIWKVGDTIYDSTPTDTSYIGQVCTVAGGFTGTGGFAPAAYGVWAGTTAVRNGQYVYTAGNKIYRCVNDGTTSGAAPTHTSGSAIDGTAWWLYVGAITAPTFKTFGLIGSGVGAGTVTHNGNLTSGNLVIGGTNGTTDVKVDSAISSDGAGTITGVVSITATSLTFTNVTGTVPLANGGWGVTQALSVLTYNASTMAVDFNVGGQRTITVTGSGNITLTTSNLSAGRSVTIYVTNDAATCNFTLPAWIFVGSAAPASMAANKHAIFTLNSTSTTDGAVFARYSVEP